MVTIEQHAQGLTAGLPAAAERDAGIPPDDAGAPAGRLAAPPDEAAARRTLRAQVARLERELSETFVSAFPRTRVDVWVAGAGGPRLLSLGELEALRDALLGRLRVSRRALAERGKREAANRELLERMLREPRRHRFVRLSNAELGEPGCGVWQVRPRMGLIGMLVGWWQVKLSSGCP